jgi:hypothetical protein
VTVAAVEEENLRPTSIGFGSSVVRLFGTLTPENIVVPPVEVTLKLGPDVNGVSVLRLSSVARDATV